MIESLNFDAPKTKDFVKILEALGIQDKKSLLVLGESNKNVYLSSRNFKGSSVVTASDINTYGVLNAQKVILSEDSLEKLENVLRR